MAHTIIKDVAIGFGVIVVIVFALIVIGVIAINNDEANGNNPFE